MKQINLAIMSVAIIGAGIFGITSTSLLDASESNISTYSERTGMLGHITAVHKNADGDIIAYVQTDNVVQDEGKDCLAFLTFGAINKTSTCAANQAFNEIGLYDTTQNPDDSDDTFAGVTKLTGNGLDPCNVVLNNGGTDSGYEDQYLGITSDGKAFIQCTFTATSDSLEVQGAVLNNNGTSSAQFAGRNFTSTLTLNTNDKLTVAWDITLT